MLLNWSIKLGLMLLIVLFSTKSYAQSEFQKDSIQIITNANKLIATQINTQNQDSLVDLLRKDVLHANTATEDLIQYYLARHYYLKQNADKAFDIVHAQLIDNYNANQSDAKYYNMKGAILSLKREYVRAIKSFLNAAEGYQKQNNLLREHLIYNNIANIYLALGDHDQAYHYIRLCFEELQNHTSYSHFLSILGVLIVCENNVDKLASAEKHLQLGLKMLDTIEDVQGEAILNFGKSEWEFKNKRYHKAIPFALKSKEISEKYGLTQFKIMSLILLMDIHNHLGENQLAIDFGSIALRDIASYNNLSMEHSITNGLATAYASIGSYEKAYTYKKQTDSLKSLDRNESNKRIMDRLLIKFETLKNRNKILKQEALIAIQNNDLERRKNFLTIVGSSLLFALMIIVGIIIFNRQRLKLIQHREEEKILKAVSNTEEKEKNRISSELHDGVAADLTALKLELERTSASDKALMILQNAHQTTRKISHNLSPYMINEKGLIEALRYLVKNNNINGNLKFFTNITTPLSSLDQNIQIILFRSTQELLQNALKYAEASEIVVQIMHNADKLSISIEDNGIGMEKEIINNSVGLGSLKRRIELIQGEFHLDTLSGKGTTAFINLKL